MGHSRCPPPRLGYSLGFLPVPSQVLDPVGTYPGPQGCSCLRQASDQTQDPARSWGSKPGSPGQRAGRAGSLGAAERACGPLDPRVWGPGSGPGHCSARAKNARGRGGDWAPGGWPPSLHSQPQLFPWLPQLLLGDCPCSTQGHMTCSPLPMRNINTNNPKPWIKSKPGKLWKITF